MILCHRYRFIFIKTKKTAGTSLELALASLCGPDDVITPVSRDDERARRDRGYRTAQNFAPSWRREPRRRLEFALRPVQNNMKFYNHIPARKVKAALDPETWENYTKFTLVRNPWDRVVSKYYWHQDGYRTGRDLHDFLLTYPHLANQNWPLYTEANRLLVDRAVRFERREADLAELSRHLGLDIDLGELMASFHAKATVRDKAKSLAELCPPGSASSEIIRLLAQPEIERFGYTHPAG